MDERQQFRAAAGVSGLPDETVDWWLRFARPQLELTRDGDGPVVGTFGGPPILPAGEEYPDRMTCLATVDLAAIPAGSHDLDLPRDGKLVFLAEADLTPDDCMVVHVPAGAALVEHSPANGYPPFPLRARTGWSVPRERWQLTVDLGEPRQEEETISDIVWGIHGDDDRLVTIGGFGAECTSGIGNPVGSPEEEALLAQVFLPDELVGEDFGGSGLCLVSFLITHAALAARQFDKAWFSSDFMG